ncbi:MULTISPECIES: hypothetical protein [unclassified Halomonas]|uniref:DUF2232 domain-containing protein n=1 Tax=Halomonas sp. RT37 TaxID=2950872 RepID=A0AAU7KJY9_9GAMM|nr:MULTISPECIES: hypothetical protein [unclassified Halomonas]MBR9878246.1 hypothetical protein [Gammaproteobacteria bacterium]KJZ16742.1 hypothetical protein TW86_06780 [Halomonas sp. S2151]MAR73800.1 hypothetical protein [Halomonas sp.]MCJ8284194.1 hypothetical protein [Halomonas sp.]MCO7217014.1 hypothetical protein [Halomonas sp. OfavH-34-E]|tara:strand:+ start:899 stop:1750 length:852 start_codon:yes stop_codon:yes gene_type:complete
MLPVARWSMKGMPQATLVALVASAVPWLFWFGAAIAALVTLRKGMAPAMPVIAAAAVPAGWWWTQGDPIPLATTLLALLMAIVLRSRMRWGEALILGSLAGAAMIQLGVFLPKADTALMLEQLRQSSSEVAAMLDELAAQGLDASRLAELVISGVTGLVVMLAAVACLALARSWQAGLYNPGGFREEFHALRLTPRELILLVVLVIAGTLLGLPGIGMLAWIPLLMAGIGLTHGVVGRKGMNGLWLVAFYLLLITTWPMILIVLVVALIDTFADFRGRLGHNN